jgi:hypothetical protein
MRRFPEGREYDRVFVELAAGELFPEYKYRFVFRGIVEKLLGKPAAAAPGPADAEDAAAELDRQLEQLPRQMVPESLEFNFAFLEKFLGFCQDAGMQVIIIEGQIMPAAHTPLTRELHGEVVRRLAGLAARREAVSFLPVERVGSLVDGDFLDVAHVTPEAGDAFVQRLFSALDRPRGAPSAAGQPADLP